MRRLFLKVFLGALFSAAFMASSHAGYNPKVLRIGFQKSASVLTLIKARGTLEKRFSPSGIEVKWIEFPAGPQMLEGLNIGAIDIGYVGEAPPIFAQAAGADFVYVAYEGSSPGAEALLARKDSPINEVRELKGKKIALNKGSNVHYFLVKLLEKNGLKYSDIQPVFLAPADARAAFERGSVDAWVIWDPYAAASEKQIGARVLSDATGVVKNYAYFLAERTFATKSADTLAQLFEELRKEGEWVNRNHKEASLRVAPLQGLDEDIVEKTLRHYSNVFKPITDSVLTEQQELADVFFELKLIPKPIKVKDALP
ncbi:MAG: sulfonate ABC transporter substrate-binding protein [Candidatus Accumulibacter sp.]|jgi:sulfonate transport system substrate-binding protein|nr:sulfonate ABC transporter substrate-binding protein [Accumulibacter sp.]